MNEEPLKPDVVYGVLLGMVAIALIPPAQTMKPIPEPPLIPPTFGDLIKPMLDDQPAQTIESTTTHEDPVPPPPPLATDDPPPSFEDLYGSEPDVDPASSMKCTLSLRKEALELTTHIAFPSCQCKTSLLLESTSEDEVTAATIAKPEIECTEKELAQLNEKGGGVCRRFVKRQC